MNKTYKNAVLGLLFTLCLVLLLFSTSYLGVHVNATEGGGTITPPTEETTPPVIDEDKYKGDKYTFKDEKTIEELVLTEHFLFKLTITDLTTAETNVKVGTYVFLDGCHTLKTDTEQLRVKVDFEKGTFEKLPPITEEDVNKELEDLGVPEPVNKVIMMVISILSSFGITWASILTLVKLLKNKTKDANKLLKAAEEKIKEISEQLNDTNSELGQMKVKYEDAIKEIKELKELVYNFVSNEIDKRKNIDEVVKEVLTEEETTETNGDE